MMKKIIAVLFALAMVTSEAYAFKSLGHQTIAALAQRHLTEQAKGEVQAILKSDMSKHAMWLFTLRSRTDLAYVQEWQFTTLNAEGKSTTMDENDGIVVLEKAIAVLRNRGNEKDSLVQASLRTVIHLVADLHCLSHIRIDGIHETNGFDFFHWNEGEGKASREWKAKWYTLWNNAYFGRYRVFPLDYHAEDIDLHCHEKRAEYEKGTPRFWAENVGEDVVRALKDFPMGQSVPTNIIQRYEEVHVKCMAKASYRLAALLNDIFK